MWHVQTTPCRLQHTITSTQIDDEALLTASDRFPTAFLLTVLCFHVEMARSKKSSQPQPERATTRRNRHEPRDKPLRSKEFKKGSKDALNVAAEQHRFPIPSAGVLHMTFRRCRLSCALPCAT